MHRRIGSTLHPAKGSRKSEGRYVPTVCPGTRVAGGKGAYEPGLLGAYRRKRRYSHVCTQVGMDQMQ